MDDEFTEELYAAIETSLAGNGVRPSWVMKHIAPVIEKYTVEKREFVGNLEKLDVCDKVLNFSINDWKDAVQWSNSPQAEKWRLASTFIRGALILAVKYRKEKR